MSTPILIASLHVPPDTFGASRTSSAIDFGSGPGRAVVIMAYKGSGGDNSWTPVTATVDDSSPLSLTETAELGTSIKARAFWADSGSIIPSGSHTVTVTATATNAALQKIGFLVLVFQDPAASGAAIAITPATPAIRSATGGNYTYTVPSVTAYGVGLIAWADASDIVASGVSGGTTALTYNHATAGTAESFTKTGTGSLTLNWNTISGTNYNPRTFGFALNGSAPADTTPPTLSSPTGTATGSTTASGTVVTNEDNGTLYRMVSTSATETVATVKAAALTTPVSAIGTQSVTFSGLIANTTYYAHYVQTDAANNDSTRVSSTSFTTSAVPDTTPPTLSSPAGTGGTLTCAGSVSTNEANGTLYTVFTASATTPTPAQVEAGQDHTSAVALRSVSQTVTVTGSQTVASGAVSAGTRYAHYMHKDAAGNRSAVVSSAPVTVVAGSDTTPPTMTGTVTITPASTSASATCPTATDNVGVIAYDCSLDGGSTWPFSSGLPSISITGLTAGTTYSARFRARDAAGNTSTPIVQTFTTMSAAPGPVPGPVTPILVGIDPLTGRLIHLI